MDSLTGLTFTSIVFLIFGLLLRFFPPGINWFYGYRTKTSMENQVNWDFSQKYSSGLLIIIGLALFLIAFIIESSKINIDNNTLKVMVWILIVVSAVLIIVMTEKAMKKHSQK